ncbi:MAG: phosphoglycerate kinase, partial [Planctomycetota bacterium]
MKLRFTARMGLFLALLFGFTPRALAQAMPGVPDPVTTSELRRYADILGLSDAQRMAIEPHHDAYRQRFRTLRDTDIQRFQDRVIGFADQMRLNAFEIPPRSALEDALDDYFGLSTKVENVDDTLFNQINAVLTPEQQTRMPRVRRTRALEVYGLIAHDMVGDDVEFLSRELSRGQVMVLENLRFNPGEKENASDFARKLARLGDVYVDDAFGALHRAHASVAGVAELIADRAMGALVEREVNALSKLLTNPTRPYVAILGGAKVSDKIPVIESLMHRVDNIL